MREELEDLTRSTRAWIEWLRDSGVDEHPTSGDPAALLKLLEGERAPRQQEAQQPQRARPAQRPAQKPAQRPEQQAPQKPSEPLPGRPATAEERRKRLAVLAEEVKSCTKCRLHESRTNTAFSRGDAESELVFVGEGPGAEEDRQGQPFVGPAGQLLDKMIGGMGYERDDVYVCNVVKCRPPKNRKPEPDEMAACMPYLSEQLAIVDPKAIVGLGATGVQGLIGTTMGITRMRGTWKLYKGRWPLMPTFHPAYLLRQADKKRDVWNDLKEVMRRLGRQPKKKKQGD
jgi:uracil-DNA glycosylase family 4